MRFEAGDRLMSFSYERDAAEQLDVMGNAGRRMLGGRAVGGINSPILWFIIYTVGLGVLLELYRHYVLVLIAGLDSIPPFSLAMLQAFPVFAIIWMLIWLHDRANTRRGIRAWKDRLATKATIGVEVYPDGIEITSSMGPWSRIPWTAMRTVIVLSKRIEFDTEASSSYLPFRAFDGEEDYKKRSQDIHLLWKQAVETRTAAAEAAVGS